MYVIADHSNHKETKLLIKDQAETKTYYLYLSENEFNMLKRNSPDKQPKLVAFHTKLATQAFIKQHNIMNPEIIKI